MKPEPVPAGTSTWRAKRSSTMLVLVTNTVAGATASKTLMEFVSSSVLALGPKGTMGVVGAPEGSAGGTSEGTGSGTAGAGLGGTAGAGVGGASGTGEPPVAGASSPERR